VELWPASRVHASLHGRRRVLDVFAGVAMNKHLESMIEHANHVLHIATNSGDVATKQRVQKVLGAVVTDLDFELLEPINKQYPELRPPGL
jgi:hypothetical protein